MISDVASFLRYFDGIHARTVRDVSALPEDAAAWRPPIPEGEAGWGVSEIVRHIAEARQFFASAYVGAGWVWDPWPDPLERRETWVPALDRSRHWLVMGLRGTAEERLHRRIELIGDPGTRVSGWRVLMMLVEHEVHHRSQLATYAGLNGWPIRQLFDRSNEWVVAHRERELQRRAASDR